MKYRMLNWNSKVNAFIFLLLGSLLLFFPIESMRSGGYFIASILMLGGIGYLIKLYKNKPNLTNGDIIYLIISLAAIALSISIYFDPTWIIKMINILVGVLLIISGLINLNNLLKFKDSRTKSWWIYFGFIIFILLLGILIILDPLWLPSWIVRIEGLFLIFDTIISILLTKKINKKLMIEDQNNKSLVEKSSLEK